MVLLLLGSACSPVGTAVAAEKGNCSNLDDFVMFLTLGAVNAEDCSRAAYVSAAVEDMKESDADQTKVDIYNAGVQQQAETESYFAPYDNYLQDTDSVAWMKVEKAIAEAYKSGSTKAGAKTAARQAISDYYATKQINLIEQWNVSVSGVETIREQAEMEAGISDTFVEINETTGYVTGNTVEFKYNGTAVTTTQLVNGSNHDAYGIRLAEHQYGDGDSFWIGPHVVHPNFTKPMTAYNDPPDAGYAYGVIVNPPNSNYEQKEVMDWSKFSDRWRQIEELNANLQDEAEAYVDATWQDFETGTINASDVISSHTAMFEYGVRSANETEGLYRSIAALSLMGFDTPNMTNAGTMTVRYNGANNTGLLLAENAPGGEWQVGKTYHTSNIAGPVMMATVDGNKLDLSGEFEIVGMTSKDGSQVNSTETKKYVYKTADTSETLELQRELTNLRQEIEDRESSTGGSPSGSDLPKRLLAVVAVLGAVLLYGGRD